MQMITFRLSIALAFTAATASASTLQILGSDSESLFDILTYQLTTHGNNDIGNPTGFTPANAQATMATVSGVSYANYFSSLPVGATVTGATLDFSGVFSAPNVSSTLASGTFFYQPTFASSFGAYTVTITSTLASISLTGNSAIGYNLWPLFQNDILAGHQISVQWKAPDTFTADTSSYGNNCKNCSETLNVRDTVNFTASNTANALNISYTAPASVPEPTTMSMALVALVGLGAAGRRRILKAQK